MIRTSKLLLAACAAVALAACTDPSKVPAEAALKVADAAFDAARAEAQKLVPAETEAVAKEIAEAKAQYAAQKYKEALAAAGAAAEKAKGLGAAAAAKKDELTKAFNDGAAELTPLLDSAKAKLEELGKAKKLPKGLDKAAVEKANAAMAEISSGLAAARAKLGTGELQEAASAVKGLVEKAKEMVTSIGAGEQVAAK